jgi:hypothetical protein
MMLRPAANLISALGFIKRKIATVLKYPLH